MIRNTFRLVLAQKEISWHTNANWFVSIVFGVFSIENRDLFVHRRQFVGAQFPTNYSMNDSTVLLFKLSNLPALKKIYDIVHLPDDQILSFLQ